MNTNCPECNKPVSEKDVVCPNCGFPLKKRKNLFLYIGIGVVLIALIVGGMIFFKEQQKRAAEEAERQRIQSISDNLILLEEYKSKMDYENALATCDILDGLQYDTENERSIIDYNKKYAPVLKSFYDDWNKALKTLNGGKYGSIYVVGALLKESSIKIDEAETNSNSEIADCINQIKYNPVYINVRDTYINTVTTNANFDEPLVQGGYELLFSTQIEVLLNDIPFPNYIKND